MLNEFAICPYSKGANKLSELVTHTLYFGDNLASGKNAFCFRHKLYALHRPGFPPLIALFLRPYILKSPILWNENSNAMADYTEGSRLSVRPVCRSSVACVACRCKHHRYHGQNPACSRCITNANECVYPLSRRRGKQRQRQARLASPHMNSESFASPALQVVTYPHSSLLTSSGCRNETIRPLFLDLYYEFFHAAYPCLN